ncbi:hypothetical protein JNUCC0626_13905 [Lentzea sp. JNUCC 0626]|uniref:hypothetical protein n=1 Tax=Lentzea sp. JNUCC 0626 TaxID=3367513 RepID=UPI00374A96B6
MKHFTPAVIAGSTALMVACGAPPSSPPATHTNTPSTSVAPLPDLPERKAIDAYLGMWREMAVAGETANPRSPELARYATGEALSLINNSLHEMERDGHISKGRPKGDPQVTNVDRNEGVVNVVRLRDCGDSTDWLKYRRDNGQLVDGEAGGRRSIIAEVVVQPDGAWRVTRFAVRGLGTC